MLVNVLTPGFTTSNGSAFLFPLIVFKDEIRNAGIEISIINSSTKDLSQCDIVAIDSKQFRYIPDDRQDEIKELINQYRSSKAKIIWFDTTDSTGTLQAEMVPEVDKYMKAQLLRNKNRYKQRIYSGREHSEYYFQTTGTTDSDKNTVNEPISSEDTAKLGISWKNTDGEITVTEDNKEIVSNLNGYVQFKWWNFDCCELSFSRRQDS